MAAMLGAGDGALGQVPLEQWFFEMPFYTRTWTTATILTGVLVQCNILSPFQLFYSFRAVYYKSQVSHPNAPLLPLHVDGIFAMPKRHDTIPQVA